ncbi:hypothetical protein A3J90_07385 [candidate division WOR-1 bacterium RIFOXYC2_FULL_37_10]|uniref:Uncharacterized protein n=1 Tax=candidate division WOR-1 bacterium RIFOXYB2_FULL_37_13 TaxID=1802579 RepID=A0A1F4SN26_UNCSA|nr:MAG: hypothetical protein A2310_01005 [candidate division WOR-1 bacterium RIFOXYB2_FULL_37_13]OGC37258.1 MAG: hypothetical protein A3J90_07385 [candidate division WOR-1 bacterium RIFOXYC2_FULL_37_10]
MNLQPVTRIWLLLFALTILLTSGCSRTVTQMPTRSNELKMEIELNGTADVQNNRYFVIFSTTESYQIPLPPPNSLDEFLEPGDDPQPGTTTKEGYYAKYYSTWSGYVVIDNFGYTFVKGPFLLNTQASRETIANLGDLSNKLSFIINLETIFGSNIPNNVYFDIVTVSYPPNLKKVPQDIISPPTYKFETISGTILPKSDVDDPSSNITPSLNIINWTVTLE